MKKTYALTPGGPKNLEVSWKMGFRDVNVLVDGKTLATYATRADFEKGGNYALPDGSNLEVRYGAMVGAPSFMKSVLAWRNGAPVSGSGADPLPKWAWVFVVLLLAIPLATRGGALPAGLAAGAAAGVFNLSRAANLKPPVRVLACAGITAVAWVIIIALFAAAAR